MSALLAYANADAPINAAEQIGFALIAAMMIVAAVRVVTCRNVVHAALWLVLVLAGAAAQYILVAAEFVAVTQVLVYIGAVVVLFLFGIMLTKAPIRGSGDLTGSSWPAAALVALLLLGLLSYSLVDTFGKDRLPADPQAGLTVPSAYGTGGNVTVQGSNTEAVSDSIFGTYLLPFEVVSVLLTAALIGAIVIARKE